MSDTHLDADGVRSVICRGERYVMPTRGRSMAPLLGPDSRVSLRSLRSGEPRIGDVVLMEVGASLILHRVVSTSPTSVTTRGDNARFVDAPVPRSALIARADRMFWWPFGWLPLPSGRMAGGIVRLVGALRHSSRPIRRWLRASGGSRVAM